MFPFKRGKGAPARPYVMASRHLRPVCLGPWGDIMAEQVGQTAPPGRKNPQAAAS